MIFEILALIGILFLVALTIAAIVEVAMEHMQDANSIEIIDPKLSVELERIAAQRGSKRHKRFVYDRASRKAVLVESNRISDELSDAEKVIIDIKK